jgi:D-alanyl-D-alanine dipeptidase
MIILKYSLAIFCLLLTGCSFFSSHKEKESTPLMEYEQTTEDIQPCEECSIISPPERSEMALYMDSLGLVNIADLDSSLVVKLMYTQADNFTGEVLYDNLTEAYLHPDAAYALIEAQKALKKLHPSYSLIIYDAARPMSVQKKMWNVVEGTSKYKYVSNPNRGGGDTTTDWQ